MTTKGRFERKTPRINVGTIGYLDYGKTSLTSMVNNIAKNYVPSYGRIPSVVSTPEGDSDVYLDTTSDECLGQNGQLSAFKR